LRITRRLRVSKRISLHEEYGLNPTMGICVICNGETGEIGLLGRNHGEKAPMHSLLSFEPCDACKKKYFSEGMDNLLVIAAHGPEEPAPREGVGVVKRVELNKGLRPEHQIEEGQRVVFVPVKIMKQFIECNKGTEGVEEVNK
jgi:hypothetical protein